MQARAAIVWPGASDWSVEDIELDPPRHGEVTVRMVAAGLCHSDSHLVSGGYEGIRRPCIGGHEGAGVVEAVGPGVESVSVGDHVVFAFMPSCGACSSCIRGLGHLCERGMYVGEGFQISDHTARHHARGVDLSAFCFTGSFATHTVAHEASCVVVDRSLPLESLCLLGCAGVTGFGAAVNTGSVRPGHTTVVVGVGGIGAMAILGARYAGAAMVVAVDPLEAKRTAALGLGADAVVASLGDAEGLVRNATHGRMADQIIMAIGVGDGRMLQPALDLVGKQGRVVIVNVHPTEEREATVSLRSVQSYEKQIVGCLGGSWAPRRGIHELANLYARGRLPLDQLANQRYRLDDVSMGYADQEAGRTLRGIVVF